MKTKIGLISAVLATAFLLAACGGGGGGTTTPPTPDPSGNLTGTAGCEIPEHGTSCSATIKALAKDAPDPKTTVGTTLVSSSATVDTKFTIGHGDVKVVLTNGVKELDSKTISGMCAPTTTWDGNACTMPVQHYQNVKVVIRNGYPAILSSTGQPVDAANQTSYQTGAVKLFGCTVSDVPQPDGKFLELCQANDGNIHAIAHDVVANVLKDYTGTLPISLEFTKVGASSWTFGPNWHACMRNCAFTGEWGTPPFAYMGAWMSDGNGGWFYVDIVDGKVLRHVDAAGNQSVVYTSPDGGVFSVMVTISN